MSINKENIIYCLKHPQLSGCLECPHYKELDGSLVECRSQRISEAVSIIEDFQKIEQILKDIPYGGEATVRRIQEVIEDGNDNSIMDNSNL